MASTLKRAFRKAITPLLWPYTSAEYQSASVSFSQFGEDLICRYLCDFGATGFYVDIGAYHPMLFSNTYSLYRRGWRGVGVDPNPSVAELFQRFRPRDIFVNTAVGTDFGCVEMAMFDDPVFNCTSDQLHNVPLPMRHTARLTKVTIQPLREILKRNDVDSVNFMSIDCEGRDLDVLRSNDWSRCRPSLLCIEDQSVDWQNSSIVSFLSDLGYTLRARAVFSSIFVAA